MNSVVILDSIKSINVGHQPRSHSKIKPLEEESLKYQIDQHNIPHSSHGNGIFTYPWMVDFHGKLVGKYTYTSPMDSTSMRQQQNFGTKLLQPSPVVMDFEYSFRYHSALKLRKFAVYNLRPRLGEAVIYSTNPNFILGKAQKITCIVWKSSLITPQTGAIFHDPWINLHGSRQFIVDGCFRK